MANLVTLARIVLLFATVALIYYDDYRAALVAAFFTVIVIFADAVDGWVARRWGRTTEFGSVFDIAGDRIVENTYLIVYAHLGLLPVWMPLAVVARSFLVDALRGISLQHGRTAFGPRSMMVSRIGRWLSSSRASRALYGAAKAAAFAFLGIWLAWQRLAATGADQTGTAIQAIAVGLAYFAVGFCLVRGLVVLYDARGLILGQEAPVQSALLRDAEIYDGPVSNE